MCHCDPIKLAVAKKINKKMVIVNNDKVIYNMPFWVKIKQRKDIEDLADSFNKTKKRCIDSIIEFETKFSPRSSIG